MIVINIKQYDITTPSLMIFKYYSASSGTAVGDPRGFIRSSPKCGPARVGVECPCQVSRVTRVITCRAGHEPSPTLKIYNHGEGPYEGLLLLEWAALRIYAYQPASPSFTSTYRAISSIGKLQSPQGSCTAIIR